MIAAISEIDQHLFLYLNRLGGGYWDTFWLFTTNKWSSVVLYLLLVFLLYRKLGLKKTLITLVVVALMIMCTDQLSNLLKNTFKRPRPCHLKVELHFIAKRCGLYGFPSAHGLSSMALALFIGKILKPYYKYALTGLILWSLLLGYSRIYVGVHYPGDVLTGWILGGLIGFLFYKIWNALFNKPRIRLSNT